MLVVIFDSKWLKDENRCRKDGVQWTSFIPVLPHRSVMLTVGKTPRDFETSRTLRSLELLKVVDIPPKSGNGQGIRDLWAEILHFASFR